MVGNLSCSVILLKPVDPVTCILLSRDKQALSFFDYNTKLQVCSVFCFVVCFCFFCNLTPCIRWRRFCQKAIQVVLTEHVFKIKIKFSLTHLYGFCLI